jgi:hypothetical protein
MTTQHCNNTEELRTHLKTVMESWPLYREFIYTGAVVAKQVPRFLEIWCDNCSLTTVWEAKFYEGESNNDGFNTKSYTCRNCGNREARYYFRWHVGAASGSVFVKVGQYPPLEERVGESLKRMLDADDLKMYRNALKMRNFNMGIAAVAYLRRVVENRMNDMLDVLHETAVLHHADKQVLDRLKEAKAERRFATKADYAGDLLPSNLRPPGKPNPMAILHDLASAGLHGDSDEECVEVFDACRTTFEHVFSKMRIELDEARDYVKSMEKLVQKKAAKATQDAIPAAPSGVPPDSAS